MNVFELFGTIAINNRDANSALNDTADRAERTGERIQKAFRNVGSATLKVGKAIFAGAAAVATTLAATVEGTREYRTAMAQLDTVFVANGHSSEAATRAYRNLYAVLGDTGQATEAASFLALMCDNEEDLAKWTDICTGVFATFGDSLPIEGLMEACNETAKTGVVTGGLADALNWLGISEEDFNLKLRACTSTEERMMLIMNTLYPTYKKAGDQFKITGKSVMEANLAQDTLNRSMAKLGEIGEPIMTGLKNWVADLATTAVPYLERFVGWMDKNSESITAIGDKVKEFAGISFEALLGALQWMMDNEEAVTAAIAAIATAMTIAAIAAHPYAAAVTAVAAALAIMWQANADGDPYNHWFDRFTDEELAKLQRWVTAVNEYNAAYAAMNEALDAGFDGEAEAAAVRAAEEEMNKAYAEANAIEGLIPTYNSWNTGQAGYSEGVYFNVPLRVSEDSEGNMQGEIDGMSLESVVSLVADTSGLQAAVNATGLSYNVPIYGAGRAERMDGSFFSKASGLDYVPHDGYRTHLHKGEAILNKTQADVWRGGNLGKIESLLTQLVANTSGGQQIVLDSGALVGQIAPQMDSRLGAISSRKGRGN